MFKFKNNEEKEVSGGAIFGYILLFGAVLFMIFFVLFIAFSKIKAEDKQDKQPVTIEQTIEVQENKE